MKDRAILEGHVQETEPRWELGNENERTVKQSSTHPVRQSGLASCRLEDSVARETYPTRFPRCYTVVTIGSLFLAKAYSNNQRSNISDRNKLCAYWLQSVSTGLLHKEKRWQCCCREYNGLILVHLLQ